MSRWAIELAAAGVTTFSVGEIAALLRSDLAGLGDAARRGPDRHRTVRAAIEWSLRMVGDAERRLLCRLAVLPGSFRLATAIAVGAVGDDGGRAVVAAMSPPGRPVVGDPAQHRTGSTRYRLLEMIRAVVRDPTSARRAPGRARRAGRPLHRRAGRARRSRGPCGRGGGRIARINALYSTAVEHAVATEQTALGLRLVYDLFPAWHGATQRGTLDRWMTALVTQATAPSSLRGMVLRRQAIIAAEDHRDDERAFRLLASAEADAIDLGDRQLLGQVRATRAGVEFESGRVDGLEPTLWDAIALLEETGGANVDDALTTLADVCILQARFDEGDELLTRATASNPDWLLRMRIEHERAWSR